MPSNSNDSSSSDVGNSSSSGNSNGRSLVSESLLPNKIVIALEASWTLMKGSKVGSSRSPNGLGYAP